jgi:hypothetical protein
MVDAESSIRCRLCGAKADAVFKRRVIDRYDVSYFRCVACESLQTEQPYWLNEAYSDSVTPIDPGAAQRVLECFILTRAVAHLFQCRRLLDYGGGAGLLCRLLRDVGWDAYSFDRYASAGYAAGFTASPAEQFDLVTAFEVVEHFPEPATDLEEVFGRRSKVVLISTYLYAGEGCEWWYLCPEEGQHVFIYSKKAIDLIAARFGYHAWICNGFIIFVQEQLSVMQRIVLFRLLTPKMIQRARPFALAKAGGGAQRDFELMTKR